MSDTNNSDGSEAGGKSGAAEKSGWTGKAALAGAAIGSAALTAALLYASRRKERAEQAARQTKPAPESD